MKAALSGLLPIIDDLIDQASKFIGSFDSKAIQQAADENLKQFRDATGIPDSGGIHIRHRQPVEGVAGMAGLADLLS
jgi:hypothetical protein